MNLEVFRQLNKLFMNPEEFKQVNNQFMNQGGFKQLKGNQYQLQGLQDKVNLKLLNKFKKIIILLQWLYLKSLKKYM